MKSKLMIALVSATLLLAYPLASYAWSGGRGGAYYRSAPRATYYHSSGHHHNGTDVVPYLLGGLVLGGLLGAVLSQPTYSAPPTPTPSYGYSEPSYGGEEPPGEWVSVPGRWVDGRWVPAHRVWMPVNPY